MDEIENTRVFPLVLTEGFVVHEQVAEVSVAVDLVDPAGELLCRERVLLPPAIAEAERDVVGELVVLEQQAERAIVGAHDHVAVLIVRRAVEVVR